ncbi:hypothetical protein [Nocardioides sp. AE5]|uniref:hypothetical protein n=1 Tax=Nocardioides sp. AE5 TaxID=2962573 RepID=UPI002881E01F|nr:hypothetical protein [Nocardioides sp. AE5]MDT0201310.1 hypothetical protein [Nocardioides sp. AE5]
MTGAAVDPAVRRAREVVGLYGDTDLTWSIMLTLRLADPLQGDQVVERLVELVRAYPDLGRQPELVRVGPDELNGIEEGFANTPYGDHDPLVRVALGDDGRDLVVAMHHGAGDGLGMLGVAAVVTGLPLTTGARGIERNSEPHNFVSRSVQRVLEALLRPPARFAPSGTEGQPGDHLRHSWGSAGKVNTASLVSATVAALRDWNRTRDPSRRGRRVVVSMGLSRRPGTPTPTPTRDTAFARFRADRIWSAQDAREVMRGVEPEPEFPARAEPGLVGRAVKVLEGRLGATVLVSNLGLIDHPGVTRARLWPAPAGPAGVAVGLVGTRSGTGVTLRVRRGWFGPTEVDELLTMVVDQLRANPGQ